MSITARLLLAFSLLLASAPGAATTREEVRFASHGATLSGIIVRPDNGRATAGVVLVHGSGPDGAGDYVGQAEAFARGGVAAIVYDKRGWGKSGGDWRHRPFALLGDDAIAAANALRARGGVTSGRVGYWGISQGGWVIAEAAARDPATAFVIGVAATGVTPTAQEMWHKDQLMRALRYSPRARAIALDFWRLAFDFLVKVDAGAVPLPASVLVNERAGASTGLDYDARPAWSRVRAPVLLLYGDRDLLEPARASAPILRAALAAGGNHQVATRFFPGSSHAITTRQTGLVFDWGEAFHPAYYPTMLAWIQAPAGYADPADQDAGLAQAFDKGGQFGRASWWRGAAVQLTMLVALPLLLVLWLTVGAVGVRRRGATRRRAFDLAVATGGLLLYVGFVRFIMQSVFAQGLSPMPRYAMPRWQHLLPVAGSFVVAIAAVALAQRLRRREQPVDWLTITACLLLVTWTLSWRLVGRPL